MDLTTNELKQRSEKAVAEIKRLRDEIELDIHLAGMDAKTGWEELRQQLRHMDRLVGEATAASGQKLIELSERVRAFGAALKRHPKT